MSLWFDLYPRLAPKTGPRVRRLTSLKPGTLGRVEMFGTGSGVIVVPGDSDDAAALDPRGLDYVRFGDSNLSDTVALGGFWLTIGNYKALTRGEPRDLKFGGAGQIAYLARAAMLSKSYITGGQHPFDDIWRLHNSGLGNELGAIWYRILLETQEALRGTLEGSGGAAIHELPDLSIGFTNLVDSTGAAWTAETGDMVAQVATDDVLMVTQRLIQLGLLVDFDPDTFEARGYNSFGVDRTSPTWAAGKVRLQAATDGTIATGNILTTAERSIAAHIRRSALLVGSQDTYELARAVGVDIPWTGGFHAEPADLPVLEDIGQVQLARRSDAADVPRLKIAYGDDPLNGRYIPGPAAIGGHFWKNDLATLDSGALNWDWDEQDVRVAAITWEHADGSPEVTVEFGSTFKSFDQHFRDQTAAATGSRHTHPPNPRLCPYDAGIIRSGAGWKSLQLGAEPDGWKMPGFDDSAWTDTEVTGGGPATLQMMNPEGAYVPGASLLYRREFYIEPEDLTGAAVAFLYALDNAGTIYVNGVAVATLAGSSATNYTSDHATTLARSAFRAGYNCIAIATTDDGAVDSKAGISIAIDTTNGKGTSTFAARCDHHHHAADIDENTDGNVQTALDTIRAAIAGGASVTDVISLLTHGGYLAVAHDDVEKQPYLFYTPDGITFTQVGGARIFDPAGVNDTGRDPTFIHHDGWWWATHTGWGATIGFTVFRSRNLLPGTWTEVVTVNCESIAVSALWAPEWFYDPSDRSIHVFAAAGTSGTEGSPGTFRLIEVHPTNREMTTWSAPVQLTGTGWPSSYIDPFMVYAPEIGTAGKPYKLWWKRDDAAFTIGYSESADLTSGFTAVVTADALGLGGNMEAPSLVREDDGRWSLYANENNGFDSVAVWRWQSTDGWATFTGKTEVEFPFLVGHPTVIRLPGVLDHERDTQAHAALLAAFLDAAEHAATDHTDLPGVGSVTADAVRDAGHWEVVMAGSGATLEPVTNEAEDDWVYGWISG